MSRKYRKRLGDRRDGRKIRSLDPMTYIAPVVMSRKNDSTNFFEFRIDMDPSREYIQKKRAEENMQGFGFMHVITSAYIRMISQKPAMNRFIAGNKIYQRDDVVLSMMVKKEMSIEGQETDTKINFDPADTIYDVFEKMNAAIEEARALGDTTAMDKVARLVVKLPTGLLKAFVGLCRLSDYFGLMPKALIDASPFHASVLISNLGSLGIPPVYHHIYNFGNISTFITFGSQEVSYELDEEGNTVKKRFVRCRITVDERIADGYYMAKSFKYFLRILKHPEMLDVPPEEVIEDVE